MNNNDIFISNIYVAQGYYDWYHEARAFYKENGWITLHPGQNMPKDWWNRWVNTLGLKLVRRTSR